MCQPQNSTELETLGVVALVKLNRAQSPPPNYLKIITAKKKEKTKMKEEREKRLTDFLNVVHSIKVI